MRSRNRCPYGFLDGPEPTLEEVVGRVNGDDVGCDPTVGRTFHVAGGSELVARGRDECLGATVGRRRERPEDRQDRCDGDPTFDTGIVHGQGHVSAEGIASHHQRLTRHGDRIDRSDQVELLRLSATVLAGTPASPAKVEPQGPIPRLDERPADRSHNRIVARPAIQRVRVTHHRSTGRISSRHHITLERHTVDRLEAKGLHVDTFHPETVAVALPAVTSDNPLHDDRLPVKMLNDRILVKIGDAEGERRSSGGILIPATAQVGKRLTWAEIVAVGPNVRNIEAGDQVLFNPEDRYEVEVHGTDYIVLRERDIHAVAAERLDEGSTGLYL